MWLRIRYNMMALRDAAAARAEIARKRLFRLRKKILISTLYRHMWNRYVSEISAWSSVANIVSENIADIHFWATQLVKPVDRNTAKLIVKWQTFMNLPQGPPIVLDTLSFSHTRCLARALHATVKHNFQMSIVANKVTKQHRLYETEFEANARTIAHNYL